MADYFSNRGSTVWVQPGGPNTVMYPLLCHDLDTIDEPLGDVTLRMCRNPDGSYSVVNRDQGEPDNLSFDVVTWEQDTRDWLQKMKEQRCPFTVYVNKTLCGREDVVLNYDLCKRAPDTIANNKSSAQNVRRRAEGGESSEMSENTFSLSAAPPLVELYKLDSSNTTAASTEVEPLRAIATCTTPQCDGPCGGLAYPCKAMHVAADSAASPSTANGYVTADYASTWTAWAANPFAGGLDIAAVKCFAIDRDTDRLLAVQGTTVGAAPMTVEYSDDGGATWTAVTVGSTNGEYGMHSRCLHVLDNRHVWVCTSEANVYFSSDAGLTWTDQGAPTPGASESLYGIHFIDDSYGWAVGGFRTTPTGLFIQTTDGGAHWSAATTEPKVEMGVWPAVIDSLNVWVGLDDGTVYYTEDWGTTWTERTLPETLTNTGDGKFLGSLTGFIAGYRTISGSVHPTIMRTFDGGYDWEVYDHDTSFSTAVEYFGINEIHICSHNQVMAVGEAMADTGYSLIWYLKPTGATWD